MRWEHPERGTAAPRGVSFSRRGDGSDRADRAVGAPRGLQARPWQRALPWPPPLHQCEPPLPESFFTPELVEEVLGEPKSIPPSLQLEITEGAMMSNGTSRPTTRSET